jgi:2,3-bisphosphoglycerate-independent phosphoglycerate mutase
MGFVRKAGYFPVHFVCMTQYDASMPNVDVAFLPQNLDNTFGEYISRLGFKQLRIAETEKYAHVTFFFSGGVEKMFPGEDRVLIESPKVPTYDLKPEMSAYEVTDKVCELIKSQKYDVVILNYANCDMVGHTGVFGAAKKAVETVDECVGRVVEATSGIGGITIVTADHGNADRMVSDEGEPFTAHTVNQVPFAIVGVNVVLRNGKLADVAPTILDLMGINPPPEMDGKSLIIR